MKYIKPFNQLSIEDVPSVGGKNASLGEMIRSLSNKDVRIPNGFATTAQAYWHYVDSNKLRQPMMQLLGELKDPSNLKTLQRIGLQLRQLFIDGKMPEDLKAEIISGYHQLSAEYDKHNADVAVRSSATAEDLPTASFAGQQETYLNIKGDDELIEACKKSYASLFTDRAIIYRIENGFDHFAVALSIGIQKMIRSDLACSGVAFSLDTETGFKDVIMIEAAYGLGEVLVKGEVSPDEYCVSKTTLEGNYNPIISKSVGIKNIKLVYGAHETKRVEVPEKEQRRFCLTDDEIIELAKKVHIIEKHYSKKNGHWVPMDIEWAKDGLDNKIYIMQARPETIHAPAAMREIAQRYTLAVSQDGLQILLTGESIGQKIASGNVRIVKDIKDLQEFYQGDILVTAMTDPDWVPIMKKAGGIITDLGGRTCHAAIVSRELGIPALVGTQLATKSLKPSQKVTIDCSQGSVGYVYDGLVDFSITSLDTKKLHKPSVSMMVNLGDPSRAFSVSQLPYVSGVGLARLEFIIANAIKVHPMACIEFEKVTDKKIAQQIQDLAAAYDSLEDYFVSSLAQGIATIAAAFYPRPIIVRFSDFKTNEYRNLLGGSYFEPEEHNPMLGLRGAARYVSPLYAPAFALEIAAVKRVRDQMGLDNTMIMIPFVRTVPEAQQVIDLLTKHSLKRHATNFNYYMMVEVPSNVLLIDQFTKLFDGFSIGSNDLTQFTLAVDRDSELLAQTFDERDPAVKEMMRLAIEGAKRADKVIGICGQAPSDYPEIARYLIDLGISSISLNPDAVIPFLQEN